tara:strand:+ start:254 stop:586 length:333 start_codon:yes stop_codon:yes gene_type:complete
MTFETYKWIYQRASTLMIVILSLWIVYEVYQIEYFNYKTMYSFFEDSITRLFFFIFFIILSLLHTSIEVFHSIHDYFAETKNEKIIKTLIIFLYFFVFFSILTFTINFLF